MTMLRAWLGYLRASALRKIDGLDNEQLRWTPAPTANSCGSIIQHMAYGERWWFQIVFAGRDLPLDFRKASFALPDDATAESVAALYRAECRISDEILAGASLDDWSKTTLGRRATLRWILTHEVEETARHAGHLDITRELIDGQTGR